MLSCQPVSATSAAASTGTSAKPAASAASICSALSGEALPDTASSCGTASNDSTSAVEAEQGQRIHASAARHALDRPVGADGEAIAVGIDVGIRAARRAELLAEQPRRRRHHLTGIDERTGGLAELVEKAVAPFAGLDGQAGDGAVTARGR